MPSRFGNAHRRLETQLQPQQANGLAIAWGIRCFALVCIFLPSVASAQSTTFDLKPDFDTSIPLANPHKGWYHHYFDNGIQKYIPASDEELLSVPGMDHIYLRLSWAYLEPEQGKFHWEIIDREIEKWTDLGLKVSFRITCKETGRQPIEQQFATPKWVMELGAKGNYYLRDQPPGDPSLPWEPEFDDPIFLQNLENFLQAFAARYDGKPWLRYIDIGSIGDWGEGHVHYGSTMECDWQTRMKHLQLHTKYFKESQLVVVDDFIFKAPTKEGREELHQYVIDHGMTYRDDSILVDWYVETYGETFSVAHPELFEDVYRKTPTVLELQHLRHHTDNGKWEGEVGTPLSKHDATGADFLRGAIELMRATYIGYHGAADQWMQFPGNPKLSVELLNKCGYWYFPHRVTIPANPREEATIAVQWENRGVAPAYHPYKLRIRLTSADGQSVISTVDACNMRWMPADDSPLYSETYVVPEWTSLATGAYEIAIQMHCPAEQKPVLLPLRPKLKDDNGFYSIGTLTVH
ncbi:DUF4832 domain-containing protein [Novipirellula artificiosorum]|uniref:DUF4832 domain-containing protein n=1 Tax=Novipirellula artificiosorum TaxID=2528016 RepID=A0A5C6DV23_9BACT|nr:DUF4832 domain-containing protein [Novipirellula artificiosorum]TWU40540.1 hypothetical protein Poly41_13730 [Novipirellula artificiosorum]